MATVKKGPVKVKQIRTHVGTYCGRATGLTWDANIKTMTGCEIYRTNKGFLIIHNNDAVEVTDANVQQAQYFNPEDALRVVNEG